jgi:uncharacterized protein (DUF362 family)
MEKNITRRSFIKKTAAIGAASVLGGSVLTSLSSCQKAAAEKIDISVVKGVDYFSNTLKAVEQLGGMEKFVSRGSKVAILANPQRNNPGVFTKPELLKAVIRMCRDAGADRVTCVSLLPEKNWKSTGLLSVVNEEGGKLVIVDNRNEAGFKKIPIPTGVALKEAQIMNEFYSHDVFITMPITKDHAGNKFTGTLKNMMGMNYSICVVDATEFIITNGPFGPGEIIKPKKVIAGTDRVAIDSYCCGLWGLEPENIITIQEAAAHGLGQKNLNDLIIKETAV